MTSVNKIAVHTQEDIVACVSALVEHWIPYKEFVLLILHEEAVLILMDHSQDIDVTETTEKKVHVYT